MLQNILSFDKSFATIRFAKYTLGIKILWLVEDADRQGGLMLWLAYM